MIEWQNFVWHCNPTNNFCDNIFVSEQKAKINCKQQCLLQLQKIVNTFNLWKYENFAIRNQNVCIDVHQHNIYLHYKFTDQHTIHILDACTHWPHPQMFVLLIKALINMWKLLKIYQPYNTQVHKHEGISDCLKTLYLNSTSKTSFWQHPNLNFNLQLTVTP